MLARQYAIKYLSIKEIKDCLIFFGCDFNQKIYLGSFIRNIKYNNIDENTNKNIQMLKNLQFTNPYLLNKKICSINWN